MSDWYSEGIQFQCQGSGNCCVSRGEYGFVYMNSDDRRRMAEHLGISTRSFTAKYCEKTEGFWHLREDPSSPNCIFLKDSTCSVYAGRPTQCRTWPFWPENLQAKTWKKEVASFCPGVGKGRTYKAEEIRKISLEQTRAELKD